MQVSGARQTCLLRVPRLSQVTSVLWCYLLAGPLNLAGDDAEASLWCLLALRQEETFTASMCKHTWPLPSCKGLLTNPAVSTGRCTQA